MSEQPAAVPTRQDLVEAMSWAEDMERGRWGTAYASALLRAYEDSIREQAKREALHEAWTTLWDRSSRSRTPALVRDTYRSAANLIERDA